MKNIVANNEYKFRIGIADCTLGDIAKLSSILKMANNVEYYQILSDEIHLLDEMLNYKKAILITYRYFNVIRLPKLHEMITIRTFPYQINGVIGYRHTYVYDENNIPIIKMYSEGPYYDLVNNRLVKFELDKLCTINKYPKQDLIFTKTPLIIPNDSIQIDEITVDISMIDRYNHVNNTSYYDVFSKYLKRDYSEIEIFYKKPALINQKLKILELKQNNDYILTIMHNNDIISQLICKEK